MALVKYSWPNDITRQAFGVPVLQHRSREAYYSSVPTSTAFLAPSRSTSGACGVVHSEEQISPTVPQVETYTTQQLGSDAVVGLRLLRFT